MDINHNLIYIIAVAIIVLKALFESLKKKNIQSANPADESGKQVARTVNQNQRSRINPPVPSQQSKTATVSPAAATDQRYSETRTNNQVVDNRIQPKNEIIDINDKKDLKRMIIATEILKRKF